MISPQTEFGSSSRNVWALVYGLVIALAGSGRMALAERFDLNDPAQLVPTRCLATGYACTAEVRTDNGLLVNPAALAPRGKEATTWHLDVGNIREQLKLGADNSLDSRSEQLAIGLGHRGKILGLGLTAHIRRGRSSFTAGEDSSDAGTSENGTGKISLMAAVTLDRHHHVGLSAQRYEMHQSYDWNDASNHSTVATDARYSATTLWLGYLYAPSERWSLGLTYRPEVIMQRNEYVADSRSNFLGASFTTAQSLQHAQQLVNIYGLRAPDMVMPARFAAGMQWNPFAHQQLVMRADAVVIGALTSAYTYDPNYLIYLSDHSQLVASGRKPSWSPRAGATLKLPWWLLFSSVSGGIYQQPKRTEDGDPLLHYTWGLSRSYSMWDMDLSLDMAIDRTVDGMSYQINLF